MIGGNIIDNIKLIILGGNTSNNSEWIRKIKKTFGKDYDAKEVYYDHWNTGDKINFNAELKKNQAINRW
ncbi:MAG: hypothetical protein PHG03_03045 [Bacilli bacterium]|nr:hypothetical protein [Bacilli bacterium]